MMKFIAWYNKLSILDALDSSLSAQKLKNAACKQKLAEKHSPMLLYVLSLYQMLISDKSV